MKKFLLVAAAAATINGKTGGGALRAPAGERHEKVWYHTFFGISIESAVYGDGIIVNQ